MNSRKTGYVSRLSVTVMLRIFDSVSIMFLSNQSRVHIYIHICMRGNRRTKNTFVAVESRSLTEFYAWRVPAANPRFPPTIGHSLAASLPPTRSNPTTRFSTTTTPNPHPGMTEGRSRGSDPSTSSIDGNLTADRKARLPLRSSAKIAMKASRHLQSFSSFLVPLV